MDFLDPIYQRRHIIRLYTGYALIAIAVFLAVTILLLTAYGFQLNKKGQVIQNGLLFASTRPVGAQVLIDGVKVDKQTNTRINLPEGNYELELKRDGYRSWRHKVEIEGGEIVRYDYPLLLPEILNTTVLQKFGSSEPNIVTQTPDSRWLLVQAASATPEFTMFDLKNIKDKPTTVTLPASLYAAGGKQTWKVVDWASDKRHVLLRHGYGKDGRIEYILLDRETPAESVNVSAEIDDAAMTELTFRDGKFDKYFVFEQKQQRLLTASLDEPTPELFVDNVLEYETLKADTVVYVTAGEAKNTSDVRLHRGDQDTKIRTISAATSYYLTVDEYSRKLYVSIADAGRGAVFVYKNPQVVTKPGALPVTMAAFRLSKANYLTTSVGGRFIVAESGRNFAVYDLEYKHSARYSLNQPLDSGQLHATWLDGAHLQYAANQQLYVFDVDGQNDELLMPAVNGTKAYYDSKYSYAYTIAPPSDDNTTYTLTRTALRTTQDL